MASDRKQKQSNSIPIRFFDSDESRAADPEESDERTAQSKVDDELDATDDSESAGVDVRPTGEGGPVLAELVATRAELKRLEGQLVDTQEAVTRRQADFDNYRKRIERERGETYNRIVAEVAGKLLPVLDNLSRALESERSVEASKSKEFRHFLSGVELISRQLNEVLENFGIQAIEAVGKRFDPHIHEAVVTEPSDEHEPDTVIGELARGYRIGERLLRPAMVKVSARTEAPNPDED